MVSAAFSATFSSEFSFKAFDAINTLRKQYGLRLCSWDGQLFGIAQKHCNDMADRKIPFSNEGIDKRLAEIEGENKKEALAQFEGDPKVFAFLFRVF